MISSWSLASALLASTVDALAAAGRPAGLSQIGVDTIEIADCCQGVVSAAVTRVYQTDATGAEVSGVASGPVLIGVDMVLRVDRCVPTPDMGSDLVKRQEHEVQGLMFDAATVWKMTTTDEFARVGNIEFDVAGVSQEFSGPEGGCIAVDTVFTVFLPLEVWCVDQAV